MGIFYSPWALAVPNSRLVIAVVICGCPLTQRGLSLWMSPKSVSPLAHAVGVDIPGGVRHPVLHPARDLADGGGRPHEVPGQGRHHQDRRGRGQEARGSPQDISGPKQVNSSP